MVNLPDTCQGFPLLSKINNIHCSYRQAAVTQNLSFVCDIPCHWGHLKKRKKLLFSVQQHTWLYESVCFVHLSPGSDCWSLCWQVLARGEWNNSISHSWLYARKRHQWKKMKTRNQQKLVFICRLQRLKKYLAFLLINRGENRLTNPCCKIEVAWGTELCEAKDAVYLSWI